MKKFLLAVVSWASLAQLGFGLPMPKGIFNATGPVSSGTTPLVLLSRTDIDGVSIGERWKTLEPLEHTSPTDFQWGALDAEIVRVATAPAPKIILIRNSTSGGLPDSTPQWVLDACRTAGTSNFTGGVFQNGNPTITGNWSSGYTLAGFGGFKSCDYGKVVTAVGGIPSGDHTLSDGLFTNGSATFTSATAKFTVGDVGKTVTGPLPANTTITGIDSATSATLSNNASSGGTQSFTIKSRDTTILTVIDDHTIILNRAPTVSSSNKNFRLIGRNFITHNDHVQGTVTNLQVTQPVPWDPTYNTKKRAMITAVGNHLSAGTNGSAIKLVAAAYLNMNTEDHFIISDTTVGAPFPDSEVDRMKAAGYDTNTMIQTAQNVITDTMNAYPNCIVTVAVGSNTDAYDEDAAGSDPDIKNYLDRTVKDWARTTFPSRYSIQKNNLAEKNPSPPYLRGDSFYMIWAEGDGYSGEQMLWNCYANDGGPEGTCRNAGATTTQGTWNDGVYDGTKTIHSAMAQFAFSDIGHGISGSGIPIGTTIYSVLGLNSTTFWSDTAKLSAKATSGSGNTFTIADRACDPAKVLYNSLLRGISKNDKFIEVYQPDCLNGGDQTTIAHNMLVP